MALRLRAVDIVVGDICRLWNRKQPSDFPLDPHADRHGTSRSANPVNRERDVNLIAAAIKTSDPATVNVIGDCHGA